MSSPSEVECGRIRVHVAFQTGRSEGRTDGRNVFDTVDSSDKWRKFDWKSDSARDTD